MLLSSSAPPRLRLLPLLLLPPPPRQTPLHHRRINASFFPNPAQSRRLSTSHRLCSHQPDGARLSDEMPAAVEGAADLGGDRMSVAVGSPSFPAGMGTYRTSLGDQAFFLLAFVACTTSIAFTSLVIAAVPTLYAMKRAATSLAKLADTAREELPSTMAAVRLSGMEISDLTLELSDLSQEITDGVHKSAQAVQAAEAGIKQIGALARNRTMSMIQERANLPNISFKPVVDGAAKKTSNAVGHVKKTFMNLISRGDDYISDGEEGADKAER